MFSKLSALLLIVVISSFGQVINWTGLNDTAIITGWNGTEVAVTKAFNSAIYEDKYAVLIFNDTMNADRADDSLHAEVGYQLGTPVKLPTGTLDTTWTAGNVIDTVNNRTDGKRYDPDLVSGVSWEVSYGTDFNTRQQGQVDTTLADGYSSVDLPFLPRYKPYVRFYLKGLAGNMGTPGIVRIVFVQRKFINTKSN
jgi:hypothetical protein